MDTTSRQGARAADGDTRCAGEPGGDICPRCGAAFACGIAGGACWCAELPPLSRLPVAELPSLSCSPAAELPPLSRLPAAEPAAQQKAASCLCPKCLRELIAAGAATTR